MKVTEEVSSRRLLLWSAPIVVGHFLIVLWHLLLLVKVQPNTLRFLPPLLILVNLLPVAGLVVLAKGFPRLAASLITLPLGIAFVIGAYAHFLGPGTDNVMHIPPGELIFVSGQRRAAGCSGSFWVLGGPSNVCD